MFVYLIIALEISVLYLAFWYLYVYESKPHRIKGNPWGRYGAGGYTTGGVEPAAPFVFGHDDCPVPWPGVSDQASQAAMTMLPTWLTGDVRIAQEFRLAARLFRAGKLVPATPESAGAELNDAVRVRRTRRRRLSPATCALHARVARSLARRKTQSLLARLLSLFTRTLHVLKARAS